MAELLLTDGGEIMGKPFILDPCCGSKMFYYDKESNAVMFCDIRELHTKLCDGRELHIQPDKLMDATDMKGIEDNTFCCVIFDPPHLVQVGEKSWLAQKYGHLPLLWEEWMNKAFTECFRILKPGGCCYLSGMKRIFHIMQFCVVPCRTSRLLAIRQARHVGRFSVNI